MNTFKFKSFLLSIGLFVALTACDNEDPALPDNLVQFESGTLGLGTDETELTINVLLSRAVTENSTLSVDFEATGLEYGTDFTTSPAATSGIIALAIAAESAEASFTITKSSNLLLDGDEAIMFVISETSDNLVVGSQDTLWLSFSEIIAEQAILNINGGGPTYPNKVFIDLSANRQTAIERSNWDFGFYSGDDFRVILNSSTGMMARALDKTDLNDVTAQDTVGFASEMSFNAFSTVAYAWIDNPEGDLNQTAIAEVPATASESKVYIVQRGSGIETGSSRGWKKVRIIRNGSGYTLQHADINATTFTEVQIGKDPNYLFNYIHFENGAAEVEPAKDRWDIAWTGFTYSTNFGGGLIPYYFQDIVLQNRYDVETSMLLIADAGTYEDFTAADLEGLVYSSSQVAIGSTWRSGGGPDVAPAIRTDRFYVVTDADGNVYKLRFTALTQDGERGRPQIEFSLLQ